MKTTRSSIPFNIEGREKLGKTVDTIRKEAQEKGLTQEILNDIIRHYTDPTHQKSGQRPDNL